MADRAIGIVGLGQMGSAMASNLISNGFEVVGYDTDGARRDLLTENKGTAVESARAVAKAADRVITSLPSSEALDTVITGPTGLLEAGRKGLIVIEASTLPISAKKRNRVAAENAGAMLLDCPLSGTASQARAGDVVVYASGDNEALAACVPVFEGFSRQHYLLGSFGVGSKLKYIANLLVTIHNAAAAEALVLGMKAGLDPQLVYDVISSGAGTSRMLEVRGPSMVADHYPGETGMPVRLFQKDLGIITDFARELASPVPLFALGSELLKSAMAQGFSDEDAAAVCRVLERMAGIDRAVVNQSDRAPSSP